MVISSNLRENHNISYFIEQVNVFENLSPNGYWPFINIPACLQMSIIIFHLPEAGCL